jgi:hypothetical protein
LQRGFNLVEAEKQQVQSHQTHKFTSVSVCLEAVIREREK